MDFKYMCTDASENTEEKMRFGNNNNEKANRYACFRFVGEVCFVRMNWLETDDCSKK